tara:strand:+ start:1388 stop:1618 length:231 start_codon:yes stop_codon:yes gene_type:complete
MKTNNFIIQAALGATALLAGIAVCSPADASVTKASPFEGYNIEPLAYSGTIDGIQVNATGTIEVSQHSPFALLNSI